MAGMEENPGPPHTLETQYLLERWESIKKELKLFTEPIWEIKSFGPDKRLHYGRRPDSLLFHSVDPSLMHSPRLSEENLNKIDQYVIDIIHRLPKNGTFGVYSCNGTYCYRSFNPNEDHHIVITEDPTFNPPDAIVFHWEYSDLVFIHYLQKTFQRFITIIHQTESQAYGEMVFSVMEPGSVNPQVLKTQQYCYPNI